MYILTLLDLIFSNNIMNELSLLIFTSVTRSVWIHMALTENLLYKIVESIVREGKFWYQPEAIIGNEVDSTTLLTLIANDQMFSNLESLGLPKIMRLSSFLQAGPCAISYVCPTVEDSSWSALHADELVERHRFISRSTSARVCTPRETHHRRLDFLLGDPNSVLGYLAVYSNATGVTIRWTSNELLLQASDSQGMRLVFVGSDGIQYPTLRLPGNRRAAFELLTSLEQGLLTFAELQPSPANICDRTDHFDVNRALSTTSVLRNTATNPSSHSSLNSENPLKKFMYLCHLRSFPSETHKQTHPEEECQRMTDVHETDDSSVSSRDKNPDATKMAMMTTLTSSSDDPKLSSTTKPNGARDLLFKIIRDPVSKVQLESGTKVTQDLMSHPVCQKQRPSNSRQPTSLLSNSVDSIKLTLVANAFYASQTDGVCSELLTNELHCSPPPSGLAHCRYMKLVNTHLSDLVIHPSACYDQTDGTWDTLNSKTWTELYAGLSKKEKMHFSPTQIYQHIYHGGCDPTIRTQVWPYLLGIFKWSMTDVEKHDHMNELSQHYWSKQAEWMTLQQSLEEHKDCENVSLTPLSNGLDFEVVDTLPSVVICGKNKVEFKDEIRDQFGHVLETVQKDVVRCDRNTELFSKFENRGDTNLALLRRVLLTYIWEHLDDGYTQGMCDVIAPILALITAEPEMTTEAVEVTTYAYFRHLLQMRLGKLFTYAHSSTLMDKNFSSLRALVHVMDNELAGHMQACGEFTHFYFCYRWFLLDFKREFNYLDIFRVWETLLSAMHHISNRFEMFVALALIQSYRDVIINTRMEFTDILKFFNERAEKHNVEDILSLARKFAWEVQCLSCRSDV
ncbi:small G protein signaling modulator 1 [Paragonimus westermani]|uniref:Small G protein signaling modulator 1 n=1 Tax=Paragonimus westermani TaxID=34504 RepID=A0A5J4P2K9_9TREM|nr:small G protein signaling modulator 1 [Paragonimus westermani]